MAVILAQKRFYPVVRMTKAQDDNHCFVMQERREPTVDAGECR